MLGATTLLGAAGCSESAKTSPRPSAAPKSASITVATAAAIDHTSAFSALEKGFFKKHNLTAQVKKYPTGVEITNAVVSGEAQFGILGSYATLTAVAKDLPVRVIAIGHGDATKTHYNANQALVAAQGSGIKPGKLSTLKGKKIGLPLGASPEAYVESLLSQAGLSRKDVELANVLPADALTALKQKSVDAVAMFEPGPHIALEKVPGSKIIIQGKAASWYDPGVIVANSSYLRKNPKAVEQFLVSIAEAQRWARTNTGEAAEIATHWIDNLSGPTAEKAIKNIRFDMRLSANVLDGYRQSTVPFLEGQDKVPSGFNPAKAVDAAPLNKVRVQYPSHFSDLAPLPESEELK